MWEKKPKKFGVMDVVAVGSSKVSEVPEAAVVTSISSI